MRPALEPGDWLLVDPTTRMWPRRGTIVVVREPASELLVVKRVAARPGDTIQALGGPLRLGPDQAWLLGDAGGDSLDSRTYGAVGVERLEGRAWLRYGPPGRPLGPIGKPRLGSGPAGLGNGESEPGPAHLKTPAPG
jgi:signal peptidase I